MCKLHGYRYACGHFLSYRLSRCRATFTKRRRRDNSSSAACLGQSYIDLTSNSSCGPCQYQDFNQSWEKRIDEAQAAYNEALNRSSPSSWASEEEDSDGVATEDEEVTRCRDMLEALKADFEAGSWKVRDLFPTQWRHAYPRLEVNTRVSGASPLRREVLPEDVVLQSAKMKRPVSADSPIGYSTFQSFFMDTYSVWGPTVDIAAETNAVDGACNGGYSWPQQQPGEYCTYDDETSSSDEDADTGDDPSQLYFTTSDANYNGKSQVVNHEFSRYDSIVAYGPDAAASRGSTLLAPGPEAAPP